MAHFHRSRRSYSSHHRSLASRRRRSSFRRHAGPKLRRSATPGIQVARRVFQTGRVPLAIVNGTALTDIALVATTTTFSSGCAPFAGNGDALLPWSELNNPLGALRLVPSDSGYRARIMDGLPPCEAIKTYIPGSDDYSNFGIGAMALNSGNAGARYSEGNMLGSTFRWFKFAAQVFRYSPIAIGYDATAPAGVDVVTGIWETFLGKAKMHVIDLGSYPDLMASFSVTANNSDKAIMQAVRNCRKKTFPLDKPWSYKYVPRRMRDQQSVENLPGILSGGGPPASAGIRSLHIGSRGDWSPIRPGMLDVSSAASLHFSLKPVHLFYGLLFVVEMPIIGSATLSGTQGWQDMLLENADLAFGELTILNYVHLKGVNSLFTSPEQDPDGTEVSIGVEAELPEKEPVDP